MKFRGFKRWSFTFIITLLFLVTSHFVDEYFLVNYDISEFALGFICCSISVIARSFFNLKFPKEGENEIGFSDIQTKNK
jgi:hypothetical protein